MTQDELRVLAELVAECCSTETKNTGEVFVSSSAIRVKAAAMRLLVQHGVMEIDSESGRMIRARWTPAGKELMGLK